MVSALSTPGADPSRSVRLFRSMTLDLLETLLKNGRTLPRLRDIQSEKDKARSSITSCTILDSGRDPEPFIAPLPVWIALWTNSFFFDYRPWLLVVLAVMLVSVMS